LSCSGTDTEEGKGERTEGLGRHGGRERGEDGRGRRKGKGRGRRKGKGRGRE